MFACISATVLTMCVFLFVSPIPPGYGAFLSSADLRGTPM